MVASNEHLVNKRLFSDEQLVLDGSQRAMGGDDEQPFPITEQTSIGEQLILSSSNGHPHERA
ncbi:hypothetical protein Dimus_037273, partial [Dionaea muscipula]